ncbi:HXXEE domain-containing protein [Spiribacter insolitus]|uniref:HXXEE domain-containing protein n=1 Tax=Spiribacter insolitus TaxID=3122417 RepID=A0ABV3T570_9GAMM
MLNRIFQYWVYATPPAALLLIGLYPLSGAGIALPVYLALPIYMIHQFEEHDADRFAVFLKGLLGPERRGLTAADIWVVNVVCVWFVLLAVFYLASGDPAWGVLTGYLVIVNAVLHAAWAVRLRRYNPGLWTALLLFLPLAVWIFAVVPAPLSIHLASLLAVIILHAAIAYRASRPA